MNQGGTQFVLSDHGRLDHIANQIRAQGLGSYERPLPDLLVWIARSSSCVMLDVGANTGLYSILVAAANPAAKVYAFEPLQSVRTLLKVNLGLNDRLSDRIGVYETGVSNHAGEIEFFETINDQGLVTTSSTLESQHAESVGNFRRQTIRTITLDGWMEEHAPKSVDLIKIDVEGHEYAAIGGARKLIQRFRPMITIEVLGGSRTGPIEDMIFEEDYIDFAILPDGVRYSRQLRFNPDGWNHLLCPAERARDVLRACSDLGLRLDFI